jgi:hypothetical protein
MRPKVKVARATGGRSDCQVDDFGARSRTRSLREAEPSGAAAGAQIVSVTISASADLP